MLKGSTMLVAVLATAVALSMVDNEASAATARHISSKRHHASAHRYRGNRNYGNAAVGRAVAGAALGLIGAAAGAAAADRYYDQDYPYYGPGYSYGGYPPAPYTYGGYGYGYQPF